MPTQHSILPKRSKHGHVIGINSKVGRDINRGLMLNAIRQHQPISRAQISELTNLNKSTVSSIVSSLLEEDLLVESPDHNGGVGRNPVNLSIKRGKNFVGAISFDAPCSRIAMVDIDGTIKAQKEIRTSGVTARDLVLQCIAALTGLRTNLGPHHYRGVGASVAGIVDSSQSRVVYAANLGWSNVNLGELMREQAPEADFISVENDAKAAAQAELLLGKHQLSSANLVYVLLSAGIGAGIAVNGRILSGSTHAAGEVGHMTVVDGGEQCSCGNSGCWELYASERAPVRWFTDAKRAARTAEASYAFSDVIDAARNGDVDGLGALRLWSQHIGVGIGDMISILDPEVVVVGGSVTQIWDLISDDVNKAARGRGAFARERMATIQVTSLRDDPALIGAAALSIRKVFTDFRLAS